MVYCTVCGEELSRETVITEAVGHTYNVIAWSWEENGSSCTATVICTVCGDVYTVEAEITSETADDGSVVYTASITVDGTVYTDTLTLSPEDNNDPDNGGNNGGTDPTDSTDATDPTDSTDATDATDSTDAADVTDNTDVTTASSDDTADDTSAADSSDDTESDDGSSVSVGDFSNVALWMIIGILALASAALIVIRKKISRN